jgi:nitrogen fixation protein FixH
LSCCGACIVPYDLLRKEPLIRLTPRVVTGRYVFLLCLAFFGVIVGVNATMLTLALRTMPGLDAKNGYVASQAMNREIASMQAQDERGWQATFSARLVGAVASVSLRLIDRQGQPVAGLSVLGRLRHPALTRADHGVSLSEVTPGVYAGRFDDVTQGGWTFAVEASRGGERLYVSRNRILLRP